MQTKADKFKPYHSHGDGRFKMSDFKVAGENIIFEDGVLVFHPENIVLGSNIYIGHYSIIKAYYKNLIHIGSNTWIGQGAFLHGAGGIEMGESVGIGPYAKILTSVHQEKDADLPIIEQPLRFEKVVLKDGCDIGVGTIILPGVTVGRGSIIGAGSVVSSDIPNCCVATGAPAKVTRKRR